MATNVTPTFPPSRRDPRQLSNTLKRVLNYNDADASLAAFFSSLPAGAVITKVLVVVLTAFNAGATNTLAVGQNAGHNDIIATTDVSLAATGSTDVTRGVGLAAVINSTTDIAVSAVYTQTGAAATAGKEIILIEFEGGWSS